MRTQGTLSKWNDDRGFGFITPSQGGQDIFVHISAFPKDGNRPKLGETLTFETETDNNGKTRAIKLLYPDRPHGVRPPLRSSGHRRPKKGTGLFGRVIPFLMILGLGVYGYGQFFRQTSAPPTIAGADTPKIIQEPGHYNCDGRTRCPEMTSCAEATFFLRNCPNVQMDGDHDGVPCEQQWCTKP
jgi:cold shock CspA family protein